VELVAWRFSAAVACVHTSSDRLARGWPRLSSDDKGQFPDGLVPFSDLYVATTWCLVQKRCADFGELLSQRSAGSLNSDV